MGTLREYAARHGLSWAHVSRLRREGKIAGVDLNRDQPEEAALLQRVRDVKAIIHELRKLDANATAGELIVALESEIRTVLFEVNKMLIESHGGANGIAGQISYLLSKAAADGLTEKDKTDFRNLRQLETFARRVGIG